MDYQLEPMGGRQEDSDSTAKASQHSSCGSPLFLPAVTKLKNGYVQNGTNRCLSISSFSSLEDLSPCFIDQFYNCSNLSPPNRSSSNSSNSELAHSINCVRNHSTAKGYWPEDGDLDSNSTASDWFYSPVYDPARIGKGGGDQNVDQHPAVSGDIREVVGGKDHQFLKPLKHRRRRSRSRRNEILRLKPERRPLQPHPWQESALFRKPPEPDPPDAEEKQPPIQRQSQRGGGRHPLAHQRSRDQIPAGSRNFSFFPNNNSSFPVPRPPHLGDLDRQLNDNPVVLRRPPPRKWFDRDSNLRDHNFLLSNFLNGARTTEETHSIAYSRERPSDVTYNRPLVQPRIRTSLHFDVSANRLPSREIINLTQANPPKRSPYDRYSVGTNVLNQHQNNEAPIVPSVFRYLEKHPNRAGNENKPGSNFIDKQTGANSNNNCRNTDSKPNQPSDNYSANQQQPYLNRLTSRQSAISSVDQQLESRGRGFDSSPRINFHQNTPFKSQIVASTEGPTIFSDDSVLYSNRGESLRLEERGGSVDRSGLAGTGLNRGGWLGSEAVNGRPPVDRDFASRRNPRVAERGSSSSLNRQSGATRFRRARNDQFSSSSSSGEEERSCQRDSNPRRLKQFPPLLPHRERPSYREFLREKRRRSLDRRADRIAGQPKRGIVEMEMSSECSSRPHPHPTAITAVSTMSSSNQDSATIYSHRNTAPPPRPPSPKLSGPFHVTHTPEQIKNLSKSHTPFDVISLPADPIQNEFNGSVDIAPSRTPGGLQQHAMAPLDHGTRVPWKVGKMPTRVSPPAEKVIGGTGIPSDPSQSDDVSGDRNAQENQPPTEVETKPPAPAAFSSDVYRRRSPNLRRRQRSLRLPHSYHQDAGPILGTFERVMHSNDLAFSGNSMVHKPLSFHESSPGVPDTNGLMHSHSMHEVDRHRTAPAMPGMPARGPLEGSTLPSRPLNQNMPPATGNTSFPSQLSILSNDVHGALKNSRKQQQQQGATQGGSPFKSTPLDTSPPSPLSLSSAMFHKHKQVLSPLEHPVIPIGNTFQSQEVYKRSTSQANRLPKRLGALAAQPPPVGVPSPSRSSRESSFSPKANNAAKTSLTNPAFHSPTQHNGNPVVGSLIISENSAFRPIQPANPPQSPTRPGIGGSVILPKPGALVHDSLAKSATRPAPVTQPFGAAQKTSFAEASREKMASLELSGQPSWSKISTNLPSPSRRPAPASSAASILSSSTFNSSSTNVTSANFSPSHANRYQNGAFVNSRWTNKLPTTNPPAFSLNDDYATNTSRDSHVFAVNDWTPQLSDSNKEPLLSHRLRPFPTGTSADLAQPDPDTSLLFEGGGSENLENDSCSSSSYSNSAISRNPTKSMEVVGHGSSVASPRRSTAAYGSHRFSGGSTSSTNGHPQPSPPTFGTAISIGSHIGQPPVMQSISPSGSGGGRSSSGSRRSGHRHSGHSGHRRRMGAGVGGSEIAGIGGTVTAPAKHARTSGSAHAFSDYRTDLRNEKGNLSSELGGSTSAANYVSATEDSLSPFSDPSAAIGRGGGDVDPPSSSSSQRHQSSSRRSYRSSGGGDKNGAPDGAGHSSGSAASHLISPPLIGGTSFASAYSSSKPRSPTARNAPLSTNLSSGAASSTYHRMSPLSSASPTTGLMATSFKPVNTTTSNVVTTTSSILEPVTSIAGAPTATVGDLSDSNAGRRMLPAKFGSKSQEIVKSKESTSAAEKAAAELLEGSPAANLERWKARKATIEQARRQKSVEAVEGRSSRSRDDVGSAVNSSNYGDGAESYTPDDGSILAYKSRFEDSGVNSLNRSRSYRSRPNTSEGRLPAKQYHDDLDLIDDLRSDLSASSSVHSILKHSSGRGGEDNLSTTHQDSSNLVPILKKDSHKLHYQDDGERVGRESGGSPRSFGSRSGSAKPILKKSSFDVSAKADDGAQHPSILKRRSSAAESGESENFETPPLTPILRPPRKSSSPELKGTGSILKKREPDPNPVQPSILKRPSEGEVELTTTLESILKKREHPALAPPDFWRHSTHFDSSQNDSATSPDTNGYANQLSTPDWKLKGGGRNGSKPTLTLEDTEPLTSSSQYDVTSSADEAARGGLFKNSLKPAKVTDKPASPSFAHMSPSYPRRDYAASFSDRTVSGPAYLSPGDYRRRRLSQESTPSETEFDAHSPRSANSPIPPLRKTFADAHRASRENLLPSGFTTNGRTVDGQSVGDNYVGIGRSQTAPVVPPAMSLSRPPGVVKVQPEPTVTGFHLTSFSTDQDSTAVSPRSSRTTANEKDLTLDTSSSELDEVFSNRRLGKGSDREIIFDPIHKGAKAGILGFPPESSSMTTTNRIDGRSQEVADLMSVPPLEKTAGLAGANKSPAPPLSPAHLQMGGSYFPPLSPTKTSHSEQRIHHDPSAPMTAAYLAAPDLIVPVSKPVPSASVVAEDQKIQASRDRINQSAMELKDNFSDSKAPTANQPPGSTQTAPFTTKPTPPITKASDKPVAKHDVPLLQPASFERSDQTKLAGRKSESAVALKPESSGSIRSKDSDNVGKDVSLVSNAGKNSLPPAVVNDVPSPRSQSVVVESQGRILPSSKMDTKVRADHAPEVVPVEPSVKFVETKDLNVGTSVMKNNDLPLSKAAEPINLPKFRENELESKVKSDKGEPSSLSEKIPEMHNAKEGKDEVRTSEPAFRPSNVPSALEAKQVDSQKILLEENKQTAKPKQETMKTPIKVLESETLEQTPSKASSNQTSGKQESAKPDTVIIMKPSKVKRLLWSTSEDPDSPSVDDSPAGSHHHPLKDAAETAAKKDTDNHAVETGKVILKPIVTVDEVKPVSPATTSVLAKTSRGAWRQKTETEDSIDEAGAKTKLTTSPLPVPLASEEDDFRKTPVSPSDKSKSKSASLASPKSVVPQRPSGDRGREMSPVVARTKPTTRHQPRLVVTPNESDDNEQEPVKQPAPKKPQDPSKTSDARAVPDAITSQAFLTAESNEEVREISPKLSRVYDPETDPDHLPTRADARSDLKTSRVGTNVSKNAFGNERDVDHILTPASELISKPGPKLMATKLDEKDAGCSESSLPSLKLNSIITLGVSPESRRPMPPKTDKAGANTLEDLKQTEIASSSLINPLDNEKSRKGEIIDANAQQITKPTEEKAKTAIKTELPPLSGVPVDASELNFVSPSVGQVFGAPLDRKRDTKTNRSNEQKLHSFVEASKQKQPIRSQAVETSSEHRPIRSQAVETFSEHAPIRSQLFRRGVENYPITRHVSRKESAMTAQNDQCSASQRRFNFKQLGRQYSEEVRVPTSRPRSLSLNLDHDNPESEEDPPSPEFVTPTSPTPLQAFVPKKSMTELLTPLVENVKLDLIPNAAMTRSMPESQLFALVGSRQLPMRETEGVEPEKQDCRSTITEEPPSPVEKISNSGKVGVPVTRVAPEGKRPAPPPPVDVVPKQSASSAEEIAPVAARQKSPPCREIATTIVSPAPQPTTRSNNNRRLSAGSGTPVQALVEMGSQYSRSQQVAPVTPPGTGTTAMMDSMMAQDALKSEGGITMTHYRQYPDVVPVIDHHPPATVKVVPKGGVVKQRSEDSGVVSSSAAVRGGIGTIPMSASARLDDKQPDETHEDEEVESGAGPVVVGRGVTAKAQRWEQILSEKERDVQKSMMLKNKKISRSQTLELSGGPPVAPSRDSAGGVQRANQIQRSSMSLDIEDEPEVPGQNEVWVDALDYPAAPPRSGQKTGPPQLPKPAPSRPGGWAVGGASSSVGIEPPDRSAESAWDKHVAAKRREHQMTADRCQAGGEMGFARMGSKEEEDAAAIEEAIAGDELTEMSITDKLRLFEAKLADKPPNPTMMRGAPPRRNRRTGPRFQTQPVTPEELFAAANFNQPARPGVGRLHPPVHGVHHPGHEYNRQGQISPFGQARESSLPPDLDDKYPSPMGLNVPGRGGRAGSAEPISSDDGGMDRAQQYSSMRSSKMFSSGSSGSEQSIISRSIPGSRPELHGPNVSGAGQTVVTFSQTELQRKHGQLIPDQIRVIGEAKPRRKVELHVDADQEPSKHPRARSMERPSDSANQRRRDSAGQFPVTNQDREMAQNQNGSQLKSSDNANRSVDGKPVKNGKKESRFDRVLGFFKPRNSKDDGNGGNGGGEDNRNGSHSKHSPLDPSATDPNDQSPRSSATRRRALRSATQPVSPEEVREAANMMLSDSGGSISERLAALKRNGEDEWRKRLSPQKELGPDNDTPDSPVLRIKKLADQEERRPRSIADRLSALVDSQATWTKRVEAKDSEALTVAGKLEKAGLLTGPGAALSGVGSPPVSKVGRAPPPIAFVSPSGATVKDEVDDDDDCDDDASTVNFRPKPAVGGHLFALRGSTRNTVNLPRIDDDNFNEFFKSSSPSAEAGQDSKGAFATHRVTVSDASFAQLAKSDLNSQKLGQMKGVRPPRRKAAPSGNPLRTLASRADVKSDYVESPPASKDDSPAGGVSKVHSHLAVEARAGLASQEDFNAVQLRHATAGETTTPGRTQGDLPYRDCMLLQIKGKRFVQCRLVKPSAHSLNEGDCYILVRPDQLFLYLGPFSSVLEKAKAKEYSTAILKHKDLGCVRAAKLAVVEEEEGARSCLRMRHKFLDALNANVEAKIRGVGDVEEDEVYEGLINSTNKVYEVADGALEPYTPCWGRPLRFEHLDSAKVLVFDFGAELYVWNGKNASWRKRKHGMRLGRELWAADCDYSKCDFDPLEPVLGRAVLDSSKHSGKPPAARPEWAVFGKLNEHMETILFRGKFSNWPESSVIKIRHPLANCGQINPDEFIQFTKIPADQLLETERAEPALLVEGASVGRGRLVIDPLDSRRFKFEIRTQEVRVWHVNESERAELPPAAMAQFHACDTYVVRWKFQICQAGTKTLKGDLSKHSSGGRDRLCYFFWQGSQAGVNEQGAAALMTVDMNEEKGDQIRVLDRREPPAFLNLFNGRFVVYRGKRGRARDQKAGPWRLFLVRGESINEASLLELDVHGRHFRSQGSYLLVHTRIGRVFLWHGEFSQPATRNVAKQWAEWIQEEPLLEMQLSSSSVCIDVSEFVEGCEPSAFLAALGPPESPFAYPRFVPNSNGPQQPRRFVPEATLRLFHLTSISGQFSAVEVPSDSASLLDYCPFPFTQDQLYAVSQPALFLVDALDTVWIWAGFLAGEAEGAEMDFARLRFRQCLVCALETALDYCEDASNKENRHFVPQCSLVWAGLEPPEFTALFPPEWIVHEAAENANVQEGRKSGVHSVRKVLQQLSRTTFSKAELVSTDGPPEGVDVRRIESYLGSDEFEEVFGMSKAEYYHLPNWKQLKLKQEKGLF